MCMGFIFQNMLMHMDSPGEYSLEIEHWPETPRTGLKITKETAMAVEKKKKRDCTQYMPLRN